MSSNTDTADARLPGIAIEQLPFGVAVLEQDGDHEVRYVLANGRYEQQAGGQGLAGTSYRDVQQLNWPDATRLQGVVRSGETWWEHLLPRGSASRQDGEAQQLLRLLSAFAHDGREYLLDVLIDSSPPFVETMVEALFQSVEFRKPPGRDTADASLIARVAALASSSLTLRSICERTLAGMREQMTDLASGGVYVLESDGARIRALAEFCEGSDIETPSEPLPVTGSTDVGRLILHGYQLVTHEHGAGEGDPGLHVMPSGKGCVSLMRCIASRDSWQRPSPRRRWYAPAPIRSWPEARSSARRTRQRHWARSGERRFRSRCRPRVAESRSVWCRLTNELSSGRGANPHRR